MGTRRLLTLLLLVFATLATTSGCGGSSGSKGSFGDAAKAMPAGAIAYVDVNIDRSSSAWKKLNSLGSRFPDWRGMTSELRHSLFVGPDGKRLKGIQAALGNEAAIAVTGVSADGTNPKPIVIGYLASSDDGKLRDAVAASKHTTKLDSYRGYSQFEITGHPTWYLAVADGAVLAATTQDALHGAIDVRKGDGDSLADDPAYQAASKDFAPESLADVYVNVKKGLELASLGALVSGQSNPAAAAQLRQAMAQFQGIDSLTASLGPRDNGFALTSTVHGAGASRFAPSSSLLNRVPGSAFAFLTTKDIGDMLQRSLASAPPAAADIRGFERMTGISFAKDLVPLLSGEQLLYAGAGKPVGGALILHPHDLARGTATMHKITRLLARRGRGEIVVRPLGSRQGETVKSGAYTATWRVDGDAIVVSTDPRAGGVADEPLTSASKYSDLLDEAGAPQSASAVFYLDTPGLLALLPPETDPNLKSLGGIVAWQSSTAESLRTGLFVEVRG